MNKLLIIFFILGNVAHASTRDFYTSISSNPHTLNQADVVAKKLYSKAYREFMDACMNAADNIQGLINQGRTGTYLDPDPRFVAVNYFEDEYKVVTHKTKHLNDSGQQLYVSNIRMIGKCKINVER